MTEKKQIIGYLAGDVFFDSRGNNGLGEFKARVVVVHAGEESLAKDLQKNLRSNSGKFNAAAQASNSLKVSGNFALFSLKQLEERVKLLEKSPHYQDSVAQLKTALSELQQKAGPSNAKVGQVYPSPKVIMGG